MTIEPCALQGHSQTPRLDAYLHQDTTKAALQALSSALADAASDYRCSRCAIESVALTLTSTLCTLRAAEKEGKWSREEKKALKNEAKGVFKGIKHDVKDLWKGRA